MRAAVRLGKDVSGAESCGAGNENVLLEDDEVLGGGGWVRIKGCGKVGEVES